MDDNNDQQQYSEYYQYYQQQNPNDQNYYGQNQDYNQYQQYQQQQQQYQYSAVNLEGNQSITLSLKAFIQFLKKEIILLIQTCGLVIYHHKYQKQI